MASVNLIYFREEIIHFKNQKELDSLDIAYIYAFFFLENLKFFFLLKSNHNTTNC